ncbi:MAG: sensor histidine kinase [Promethearchaeota archaeon]|jgi:PAS domain S-box-containing protein
MSSESKADSSHKVNPEILEFSILFLGLILVFITHLYNYLLFHSIVEIFSIVIAGGVFLVGWSSRKYMKGSFFLILGISSLFLIALDLIHTLSYSDMQIFTEFDANLPTSLWIAARYLQAGSFLFASFTIKKPIKPLNLFIVYLGITLLLFFLIFFKIFPTCYILGQGLTLFKKASEYIIIIILIFTLYNIVKIRIEFDKKVFSFIILSIFSIIISEFFFTLYFGVTDIHNLIGHLFKVIAFFLLYKAIIQIGIEDPFDLLFRKVKRSELELRNIIKHSGAGITMLDQNGHYLLINKKAANDLGGNPEDFIGKSLYEVLPEDLAEEYFNSNRELIQNGINRSYQRTFNLPSGKKTFWITEQPIKSPDESSSSLLIVATDITKSKKAEEALKIREHDLKERVKELTCLYSISKLVEQIEIPIEEFLETTLDYIPKAWQYPNITCARIIYQEREFKTPNFKKTGWMLKKDILEFRNIIGRLEVGYLEEMPIMNEGPFFKEERDLINGISEMIGTFIERKKAEERLSQLISTVSHELRTPITVLLMSMEYLSSHKESLKKDVEEKLIEGISRNVHLLNDLAEDILLVSKIDEHKLELNFEEYSPLGIVNEILFLLEPIGKEKNIDFEVDIDSKIRLMGDTKRIDQIFRIIIDNSIKYSSEGSKVEISAINDYKGNYNPEGISGVLIKFKDSGRGIPPKDLPHIFERFYRSSNVYEIAGTGLGLAIAKDLVIAHQGEISLESELGIGTTFHLFLPYIKQNEKFLNP